MPTKDVVYSLTNLQTANSTTALHEAGTLHIDGATGKTYRYVYVKDLALQVGDSVELASATYSYMVSKDRSGGSTITGRGAVGVAIGTISASSYGWVQIRGEHTAVRCDGGVAAGDYLVAHATQDGRADTATTAAGSSRGFIGRALAADSTATSTTATARVYLSMF